MEPSNPQPPSSPPAPSERPTLLTPGTPGAADPGSSTRMLASLERDTQTRGGASTGARRFSKAQGIALLAFALLAGGGAFVLFAPGDDASGRSAAASSTPTAAAVRATPPQPGVVTLATGVVAADAASAVAAASAPTAAQIEPARAAALSTSAPGAAVGSTEAGSASAAAGNSLAALARNDADSSASAASAPGLHGKKAHSKETVGKPLAPSVASTKGGTARADGSPARPARRDDEDADTALVAAMIARLDRRAAALGSSASAAGRKDDGPALAEMLRQCESKSDPLDARRCRNRACETHWGKADACPAARAPKGSLGAGVERGKPA